MKSFQEAFDEILVHMRALGGKKVTDINGNSLYKTKDKESGCPIGRLIPNHLYKEDFEGMSANQSSVSSALYAEGYDPDFCELFQIVHDKVSGHRWEDSMYIIARDLELQYHAPIGYQFIEGLEILDIPSLLGPKGVFSTEDLAIMVDGIKAQIKAQNVAKQVMQKITVAA